MNRLGGRANVRAARQQGSSTSWVLRRYSWLGSSWEPFRGRIPLGAVEDGSPKRIVRFGNGRNGARSPIGNSGCCLETKHPTSIDQCASRTRQDDGRSPESVRGPLIFRATDAPDRDLCHRYADRRLWLALDHDWVQPIFAGVTARELRVCQPTMGSSATRNDETAPSCGGSEVLFICAANSRRELPNQNHTRNPKFARSLRTRSSQKNPPQNDANFGPGH
jgi:hypothetical protein